MTEFRSPVALPPIPDHLSIPQFILRSGSPGRPNRPRNSPFFIEDATGRTVSHEEAHRRTYGLANALSIKWNIGRNDVVCLFSPNHIDYAIALWAVHTLGAIVTPANPNFSPDELKYQLDVSRAKLLIVHPSCLNAAEDAAQKCNISEKNIILIDSLGSTRGTKAPTLSELIDFGSNRGENYEAIRFAPGESKKVIAFLSFSSGTTGKKTQSSTSPEELSVWLTQTLIMQAVSIPHYSVIANLIQMGAHYRLNEPSASSNRMGPGDVALGALPFFHIYGLIVIMHYGLYAGASIVVVPKFNFTDFLSSLTKHRLTHLYLVPPMCVLICKHPAARGRTFEHVRFLLSGAAPLGGDLMASMAKVFPNASIGQGYGLTETATTVCSLQYDRKLGTIGSAGELIPGVVARVVKPDGTLAKEGEQGELVVSGPSMPIGYYENPTATAETFIDGWVHTGDEVVIKNLEVFVVDRLKEIMKVRGFQVAPAELEAHLLLHPHVADACVVGVPDEYSGEVPLAFIVLSESAREFIKEDTKAQGEIKQAISKHVSDAKVHYKWLKGGIVFIDTIPKNPSGKILRRILRDKAKVIKRESKPTAKL